MSRVIKFRGYDQENKCWRYGHYYEGVMTDAPLCLNDCRICRVIIIDGTFYHVAPESVSQFTGLTDCNGVEIYESDVVADNIGVGIVKYSDQHAGFRVAYGNGRAKWFYDYMESERKTIEVIGNIYEHPHLLNRSSA